MDKKEFAIFASALRTYYPKEQILPNNEAMELWFQELKDIPMEVASAAMRKWVSTQKWSPSIAEIREECATIVNGEQRTWQEGWDSVLTSIRKFGVYSPKEAMQFLEATDPIAADCVMRMGYRNLCMSENAVADRAAFRNCYEVFQKRKQMDQQIALPLQNTIKQIQMKNMDGMLMIGGID